MLMNYPVSVDTYIENHKEYINYCEAVIFPDGTIMDAVPCHIDAFIKATNESKHNINLKMPQAAAPLEWLVGYTNCIAIWFNMLAYHNVTQEQIETISILLKNKIIAPYIDCKWTNEMEHCQKLQKLADGDKSITFNEPVSITYTIDEFLAHH